jgi:hypothetical protein
MRDLRDKIASCDKVEGEHGNVGRAPGAYSPRRISVRKITRLCEFSI